jgi:hypothetical protein
MMIFGLRVRESAWATALSVMCLGLTISVLPGCPSIPPPTNCDDGDACTTDTVDATGTCVNTPVACSDGETCDPATGDCIATDLCAGNTCDDGDACNGVETCDAATGDCVAGTPVECANGETCDPATGQCGVTVPQAVKAIIDDNCARCHVTLPAGHTGSRDVDQCGLCHISYGTTVSPTHDAATAGCTLCHTTPEETHFYLRDDDDQLVLKADAADDCIGCHRDGGNQTNGAGRPALDTDEDIFAAARWGTLRSWIQPGGFMAKYLTDAEVATITNWIDDAFGDRTLGYDPYLDAASFNTDFDISGRGDNPAWSNATEHVITLTPTVFTATAQIALKALYSDTYLYIRAEHTDSTLSMTRSGSWILDGDAWRHPTAITENDKQSEDRVAFLWNIAMPQFKERFGCAIKCHGNVPGSSEFSDLTGSVGDIWHTKAARGLALDGATINTALTIQTAGEEYEATAGSITFNGVLDDKWLVWYQDFADGYDTEDSGRRGDGGGGAYSHNRNGDKSAPKQIETDPVDWADAMVLTQQEIDDGETIVADPAEVGYDAVAVAAAWANYAALDAVVSERILRQPEGSRGDVLHAATWSNGTWVHEFRRELATGNADDVQFDLGASTEYEYGIAVFDNCGRGEIPPGHNTYGDGQYQILRFLP